MSDKPVYHEHQTIRESLQHYFEFYGFNNGGYDDKWFKIKLSAAIAIPLPNVKARVEAVKLHDIHHIVTGYPATLKGEALIGAWELASGCGRFYIGWLLDFGAFLYGIWFWPREMRQAFMSGLKSHNLYHGTEYDDNLLSATVGDVRKGLLGKRPARYSKQRYVFLIWVAAAIVTTALAIVIPLILLSLAWKA
jgi:hypothetical protein